MYAGHDPKHIGDARAVIYTSAVDPDHPVLEAAAAAGIPTLKRAEALSLLLGDGVVVGVAGTHGKTTTTAMVTESLSAAGRDPTGSLAGASMRGMETLGWGAAGSLSLRRMSTTGLS